MTPLTEPGIPGEQSLLYTVLGQPAVDQVDRDIREACLAPSMLFSGPAATGKGTAALELARRLCCTGDGAPACLCGSCVRHRLLTHQDLLMLGSRTFYGEIHGAAAALEQEPACGSLGIVFVRAVRKLLARFNPVLWEDDTAKLGKLTASLLALEEDLDEVSRSWFTAPPDANQGGAIYGKKGKEGNTGKMGKIRAAILKTALKLEADGISEYIPINHIRRAAYWSRLAPSGPAKVLLIENADRMQDGARNALLKILEEPPERVTIILTTSREETLLPTILSRVRPYRFLRRSPDVEAAVLATMFHATADPGTANVAAYLDSFLPVSGEALGPLAAYFAAAAATRAAARRHSAAAERLAAHAAPRAEAAGFSMTATDTRTVLTTVLDRAKKFEARSQFAPFLSQVLALVSAAAVAAPGGPDVAFCDRWRRATATAAQAVGVFNQNPALALERLLADVG